jgi:hypothetical protein
MPSLGDIVNTITIRGVADGVDATTAATKGLKAAFDAASEAAKSSAEDISGAFDGIQKSIGVTGAGGGGGISFLASIGLGAAASAAGLGVFLEWVQKTNKELADMGHSAQQAGLDLASFQKLQFTAGSSGMSASDFTSGAEKMAANLDEAGRKENDLSKLLKANNVDLKDSNGILISNNKLWDVARDLISRAKNVWQAGTMADNLGLNDKFVPMLSQSAAEFRSLQDEAKNLGVVINDEVIARAKVFDSEWRKSSLIFSTEMKAAFADLMPTIDDYIAKAKDFIEALKPGSATTKQLVKIGFAPDPSASEAEASAAKWKEIYATITDPGPTDRLDRQRIIWEALKSIFDGTAKAMNDYAVAWEGMNAASKSGAVDDSKAMNDYAVAWEGMSAASKQYDVSGNTTSGVFDLIKQKATAAGLSIQQTSALMAAAQAESSMGKNTVGDNGTSFGLFQFHQGGELDPLKQYAASAGKDWQDFGTQIDYVIQKAQGGTDTFSKMWKSASSDADASKAMDNFEKFQGYLVSGNTESQKRITLTQQYDQALRSGAGGAGAAGATNQYSNLIQEPDKAAPWDKAVDAVNRHIAVMAADSLAVGKSAADTDQLKTEFQLLEGARRADKGVTDDQIKQYTDLRAYKTADQALDESGIKLSADRRAEFDKGTNSIKLQSQSFAELKIANQISFGQQTAFLSPQDVQIANQLKGSISDVTTALNSSQAAALRLNQGFAGISTAISGGMTTAIIDLTNHTKSAGEAFKAFGLTVVTAIEKAIIELMIVGPLMRGLQGGLSSIFPGIPGLGGGAGASATLAASNASGTLPAAADVAFAFKSGGMVGRDGQRVIVSPAYFENAPRFDTGGMITDGGVPIIAHPGERVLNRQQTAAYNSGASSPVTIHMGDTHIDASGADPAIVARMQAALVQDRKQRYGEIVKVIQDASNRGLRLHP